MVWNVGMGVWETAECDNQSGAFFFFLTLTWVERKISHISEIPHAAAYKGDDALCAVQYQLS